MTPSPTITTSAKIIDTATAIVIASAGTETGIGAGHGVADDLNQDDEEEQTEELEHY